MSFVLPIISLSAGLLYYTKPWRYLSTKPWKVEEYSPNPANIMRIQENYKLDHEKAKHLLQLKMKRDHILDNMHNADGTNPGLIRGYQEAIYPIEAEIDSIVPSYLGMDHKGKQPSTGILHFLFVTKPHNAYSD